MGAFSAIHADLMEEQESVPYEGLVECPECKGDGISRNEFNFEYEDGRPVCRYPCDTCEGEGCVEAGR